MQKLGWCRVRCVSGIEEVWNVNKMVGKTAIKPSVGRPRMSQF
jgi:hypothetical protein